MAEDLLPPEHSALFLTVRRGIPLALAAVSLACAVLVPSVRGWCLLLTVAALGEVGPTFRHGSAYVATRPWLVRWDGLWATAFRPLARLLGQEDAWLRSFCDWNNRRVREVFAKEKAQRALLLLPHCIQLASCRKDIQQDLGACPACGRCDVGNVLEAGLRDRWDVRVSNRSYKAYLAARESSADLVVAVCCTDRLLKGLTRLPERPAYVVPLALPHGMCVDTTCNMARVRAALEALVEPRPAPLANIQPMHRGAAS